MGSHGGDAIFARHAKGFRQATKTADWENEDFVFRRKVATYDLLNTRRVSDEDTLEYFKRMVDKIHLIDPLKPLSLDEIDSSDAFCRECEGLDFSEENNEQEASYQEEADLQENCEPELQATYDWEGDEAYQEAEAYQEEFAEENWEQGDEAYQEAEPTKRNLKKKTGSKTIGKAMKAYQEAEVYQEEFEEENWEQDYWEGDEAYQEAQAYQEEFAEGNCEQDSQEAYTWEGDEAYQEENSESFWENQGEEIPFDDFGFSQEIDSTVSGARGQCIFFDSSEGCRKGDNCPYRHDWDPSTGLPLPAKRRNRSRYRRAHRNEIDQQGAPSTAQPSDLTWW